MGYMCQQDAARWYFVIPDAMFVIGGSTPLFLRQMNG